MPRDELGVGGPDNIMDIIRQQSIQVFTLSQCLFRVLSFGNVPGNGHIYIFPINRQPEGADFDREFRAIFFDICCLVGGVAFLSELCF